MARADRCLLFTIELGSSDPRMSPVVATGGAVASWTRPPSILIKRRFITRPAQRHEQILNSFKSKFETISIKYIVLLQMENSPNQLKHNTLLYHTAPRYARSLEI